MKIILSILLLGTIVLTGCSDPQSNVNTADQSKSVIANHTIQTTGSVNQPTVDNKEDTNPVTNDKDNVTWSHKEITNLQKLDDFIKNVSNNVKDQIRVVSYGKDGGEFISDLSYDGKTLQVTKDGVPKEYKRIFIEERFNEHYNGVFIEYFVEDAKGQKELIMQIHPDLSKNQD